MSAPGERDLTFKLYGLDHMNGVVYADLFAQKVTKLVAGLKRIDREKNGGKHFEYTVIDLKYGSTELAIHQKFVGKKVARFSPSAELAMHAMRYSRSDYNAATEESCFVDVLDGLCSKAGEKFSYGVVTADQTGAQARVDPFLGRIINRIIAEKDATEEEVDREFTHFRGAAIGSFDGTIEEVDVRDREMRSGHLILSAGNYDVRCIFNVPIDEIALNRRVTVEGEAIYDGSSSLPTRIIVQKITLRSGSLRDWTVSSRGSDWSRPIWPPLAPVDSQEH